MKRFNYKGFSAKLAVCGVLLYESSAGEPNFRTDINPALLYFQAFQANRISEADANYLFDTPGGSWSDVPVEERRLTLLKQFDAPLKLVRRARFAKVPCDWGYDLSDGPEALLPGLAPAKRVAQAARLRGVVALSEGRFDDFREEFAAVLTLARNVSTDHILISCLVQIAIENILTSVVMENYYRLSADQLDQLVGIIDSAPKRGTVAEPVRVIERQAFFGYVQRKVNALSAETTGNDLAFWTRFAAFWDPIATDYESKSGPDPSAKVVQDAAGGTRAGLQKLLDELPPLYEETARVLALPYAEYKQGAPALFSRIADSRNPLVRQNFGVFKNLRVKEFSVIERQEMVRAAAAYKRSGTEGLNKVHDPLIGGPFEFNRAVVGGEDRGFILRSKEQFRDFPELMTFIEKPGKHFYLDGKNAGQPL